MKTIWTLVERVLREGDDFPGEGASDEDGDEKSPGDLEEGSGGSGSDIVRRARQGGLDTGLKSEVKKIVNLYSAALLNQRDLEFVRNVLALLWEEFQAVGS